MAVDKCDIRWCPRCREGICEDIFERVPYLWPSYREKGRVDRGDEVFQLVEHAIPTFLECTLPDDLRECFKVDCSTGQGVAARSPRYSFPTMGSTRRGIFVCSQYDARSSDKLGDYRISIIVGRDELRNHTQNPSRALDELVHEARRILDVGTKVLIQPQGSYDREIVHQITFPLRNAPTAEEFRKGLNLMLRQVAEKRTELDALWFEVLRRAEHYPPDPVSEERQRRGTRGEQFIIGLERSRLERVGRPDLAHQVRKISPREANHDILTFRFRDGDIKKHYMHWLEVKTTSRGQFRGKMSRKQSEFALEHPDTTSLVIIPQEAKEEEILNPIEITSLEERVPFLHSEVARGFELQERVIS